MKMMPARVLVIIPTYNEVQNIALLLPQLFEIGPHISVLVVDDNSTDGTPQVVKNLCGQFSALFLLSRPGKSGLGSAYRDGFRFALERGFEVVLQMDADLTHRPVFIAPMLAQLSCCDVVVGSRYIEGGRTVSWPFTRWLLSQTGNFFARTLLRLPVYDVTSGFKCFRRKVLLEIGLETMDSEGYIFQVEFLRRTFLKGFRVEECPIVFEGRVFQESKISPGIFWEGFVKVLSWAGQDLFSRVTRARTVMEPGTRV